MENQSKHTVLSDEEAKQKIQHMVDGLGKPRRSPIMHTPAEEGLEFEDVFFQSLDGVPLEGWLIPAKGSDKLIIVNHPMGFSRSGFPAHLEPWKSAFSGTGNDFEINFISDFRVLHDAGYNILAYDLRHFGQSGVKSGTVSNGIFESRDVVGSLIYAKSREDLKHMRIGLFSRCLGASSTIFAIDKYPEYFKDVLCLVAPQPLSVRVIMERELEMNGISDRINELEQAIQIATGFKIDELTARNAAQSVKLPTLMYGVHDDLLVRPKDIESIYANIGAEDKKFFWIEGTTSRWQGYAYFAKNPDVILDWFATHMN